MIGKRRQDMIKYYSIKIFDGVRHPVEVTDYLWVLSAPIGSIKFCQNFITENLHKANNDATFLLSRLEDFQTILRLYSMCNKITSLFNLNVFNSPIDHNLAKWLKQFYALSPTPPTNPQHTSYSHIIANMSINEGGLCLQHPLSMFQCYYFIHAFY